MIVVVADDFTGAVELAGVGLRYGLKAEVQTVVSPNTKAELAVIDADTRSLLRMTNGFMLLSINKLWLLVQPERSV